MHARPPEVPVDEENTEALLSESKGIIGAGETLSFIRHSAGEKRNLTLGFRSEE